MPRVPVPSFSDTHGLAPLPGPMQNPGIANPNNFGAQLGDAIQNSADIGGLIYQRAKHEADVTAVVGAMEQGKQALNDIVLDTQKGYASLKGADALAARQPTLDAYDKALADAGSSLANDEQKRMWQDKLLSLRE